MPADPLTSSATASAESRRFDSMVPLATRICGGWTGLFIAAAVVLAGCILLSLGSLPWLSETTVPAILLPGLLLLAGIPCMVVYRAYCIYGDSSATSLERVGPYILKEKIGAGGMGEVYRAEHQLMTRECAVKLINRNQANNREMRESFEQEAKATAQLTHWNTVEVYDYGTTADGRFYYVMEYLQGVNLSQFVTQYGPMPAKRVAYILKQICEALYEAECVGLVHRDIKPSNIFLTERGRSYDVAKLLDFGLVKAVSEEPIGLNKVSTKLRGSPAYMCPEQAVGLNPDCRGDLYSLGCVAYFLLTGRAPFTDDNPIMLIVAHATTDVPTFEDIGAEVPNDFAQVVLKCLKRDPEERYSSARELLADIESCSSGTEWTWKCADDWWSEYQPRSNYKDEGEKFDDSDTKPLVDRDTKSDAITFDGSEPAQPRSQQIDYDHETVIYQAVENAQNEDW